MASTRTETRARQALVAIAVITIASGLGQLALPGFVLRVLSASSTPTSRHFFAIVGMFMAVVGGLLLQALRDPAGPPPVVLTWAAAQKLGAAAAVGLGVARGIFSPLALSVAGFDLLSGVLLVWYRCRAGEP